VYSVRLGKRYHATEDVKDFVADLEAYCRQELDSKTLII
jgi:hypothetical protein